MSDWFRERAGLDGAVAFVVGGAGGLGEAITDDLVANGVRVAVLDLDAEAVTALALRHPDAIALHGDARDPDALTRLFAAVDDRWDRLDVLVNVVGGTFRAGQQPTRVGCLAAHQPQHGARGLLARDPADPSGWPRRRHHQPHHHRGAPCGSRVRGLLRRQGRRHAVRPDACRRARSGGDPRELRRPGLHADAAHDARGGHDHQPDGSPPGARVAIPMGRTGRTTDVASCVVFLASGLSEYVTGTTLHPDGGALASSGGLNWPYYGWANHAPPAVLKDLS